MANNWKKRMVQSGTTCTNYPWQAWWDSSEGGESSLASLLSHCQPSSKGHRDKGSSQGMVHSKDHTLPPKRAKRIWRKLQTSLPRLIPWKNCRTGEIMGTIYRHAEDENLSGESQRLTWCLTSLIIASVSKCLLYWIWGPFHSRRCHPPWFYECIW